MPSNAEAISYFHKNGVEFAPAKAANAGGVAVSGLEMAQNSARLSWSKDEVDNKLKVIHLAPKNAVHVSHGHIVLYANLKIAEAIAPSPLHPVKI